MDCPSHKVGQMEFALFILSIFSPYLDNFMVKTDEVAEQNWIKCPKSNHLSF